MKYMYKQTHMHTNKLTYKRNSFVSENTAIIIIIKFNLKSNVNNKNLTENNKNNLWKVKKKKITQNKRFSILIPFLEMSEKEKYILIYS